MRRPRHLFVVTGAAGWRRTARFALPFLLSGLPLVAAPPAVAQTPLPIQAAPVEPVERIPLDDPFAALIAVAARRFRLPTGLIRAVLQAESGGDPRARSSKGAMGLMQIMPETWADLRGRYVLGDDPYNPRDSILAGTAYLRELLDRYGSPGFLAAYNAGPARYEDYLAGRPLPDETRAYLTALGPLVMGDDPTAERAVSGIVAARSWTMAPLFAGHAERTSAAGPLQPDRPLNDMAMATQVRDLSAILPQSNGLFVPLGSPERRP